MFREVWFMARTRLRVAMQSNCSMFCSWFRLFRFIEFSCAVFVVIVNLGRILCSASKFSNDGSKLAVTTPNSVVIYDTDSGKVLTEIPAAGVASAVFSPLDTYLQTFQKPQGQQKNLILWDVKTGSIVLQQFQKAISKTSWLVCPS